jgi:cytochrome c
MASISQWTFYWSMSPCQITRSSGMAFYVSHMTPHRRARIHKGDCVHCRDGRGQENQARTGSGATGWSPPLETVTEAEAYMEREFPRFTNKGKCPYCMKEAS